MQHAVDCPLWRQNFIEALHLVGQAAGRLPIGIPDPVLCRAAAIELYTGGLWSTATLALRTIAARSLTRELFEVGFRLRHSSPASARGLQHPELKIGIDFVEDDATPAAAWATNIVWVAIDRRIAATAEGEPVSVKVVGVEDLIVEEAVNWLALRGSSEEVAARLGVLAELGQEGVGGGFRADYLERRLARETDGEVVLSNPSRSVVSANATVPRSIALSEMQGLIHIWRTRCGFSCGDGTSRASRRQGVSRAPRLRSRARASGRAGGPTAGPNNVVPFDTAAVILHLRD
jgi:hypothetical protein